MADAGQDMQSRRGTPAYDFPGDSEKARIGRPDDPAQRSGKGRQRLPKAGHARESVLLERGREPRRALA